MRAVDISVCQEKNKMIPAVECEPAAKITLQHPPASLFLRRSSSPHPPFLPSSSNPILFPSVPLNIASSSGCQLLDFFGENLAYIDESSDTLSDRVQAAEERRRRPRKPKRRSMRRQLSPRLSPTQLRRPSSDTQPPSNPPTPPPDSSLSDLPPSEDQTGSHSKTNHTQNVESRGDGAD